MLQRWQQFFADQDGRTDVHCGRNHVITALSHVDVIVRVNARVTIRIGSEELFPHQVSEQELEQLSAYLRRDEVLIHVSLGIKNGTARVWGCDLTDGYVRINADYTT